MNILTASEIDYRLYTGQVIFDHASFAVESGSVVGVVGKNGSGKSTLFSLINRDKELDSGELISPKDLTISLMHQAHTKKDVEIKNFLEIDPNSLSSHQKELLSLLGINNLELKINNLSGGQQQKLSLAKTILKPAGLYLLDEPTNHLDLQTLEKLERFIKSSESTFMIISHDRYFLDRVCSAIIEIENNQIYQYSGNYSSYIKSHQIRHNNLSISQKKKEEFLQKEKKWVDSGVKARETKNKARLKRYYDILESSDYSNPKYTPLKFPTIAPFGKKILDLTELTIKISDFTIIKDFDFEFQKNTKIGIVGNNGVGKTTLIKQIISGNKPESGKISIGQNTIINYISQDKNNLTSGKTVFDEITENSPHVSFGDKKINAFYYLDQFLFDSEKLKQSVSSLSGGEKARLSLAKEIKRGGNLLILDEPTNDLDIEMIEILENGLQQFQGVEIIISHDRYFLDQICTHILYIFGDGRFLLSHGNWSDFQNKYLDTVTPVKKQVKKAIKNDPYQKFINKQKEEKRKQIKEIEVEIEKYEGEKSKLEIDLAVPNLYNESREKFDKITKRLNFLDSKISQLWESLSDYI